MRAFTAAVDQEWALAITVGAEDQLVDLGAPLELSRRLRVDAAVMYRQGAVMKARALGLNVDGEVDAGRQSKATEEEP